MLKGITKTTKVIQASDESLFRRKHEERKFSTSNDQYDFAMAENQFDFKSSSRDQTSQSGSDPVPPFLGLLRASDAVDQPVNKTIKRKVSSHENLHMTNETETLKF